MEAIHGIIEQMGYDVRSYMAEFVQGAVWTTVFAVTSGVFLYLVAWVMTLSRRDRRRYRRHRLTRRTW